MVVFRWVSGGQRLYMSVDGRKSEPVDKKLLAGCWFVVSSQSSDPALPKARHVFDSVVR